MTAPPGREIGSAELVRRLERLEAQVRLLSAMVGGGGGTAGQWIDWAARQGADAALIRRLLGEDPPLRRERTRP